MSTTTTTKTRTAHVTTVTYGAGKAIHLGDPATPGAPLCGRTKGGVATPVNDGPTCGHCVRRWAKGDVDVYTTLPSDYFPACDVPDSPAELVEAEEQGLGTAGFADPENIPADERYAQGDRRNQIAYDRHERKAQKIAREVAAYGWTSKIEHLDNVDGTAETLLHMWRGQAQNAEYLRVGYADGGCNFSENLYKGNKRTYRPRNASAARQIAAGNPLDLPAEEATEGK